MNATQAYRELGVPAGATDAEVKSAWRRAAARWHPDRNSSPQALRKIQRINRALDVIRRARAAATVGAADDEEDDDAPDPAAASGRNGPPDDDAASAPDADADDADDAPLAHAVELSLEEAALGCQRLFEGTVAQECSACEGSGHQPLANCPACEGEGRVRQQLFFSWLSPWAVCRGCNGRGQVRAACAACAGHGAGPERPYRCRVRIPAGVRDGDVLSASARLQGKGTRQDVPLAIRVTLKAHALFTLQPDGTVCCELPVDGFAWMANRWTEVPTPGGLQQMRLRRGALVYRIRGQGLPQTRSGPRGDCLVTVVPLFPDDPLSPAQEVLVDQLIASNSRAAGTAAAQRIAAWQRAVHRWSAGQAQPGPG